MTGIHGLRYVIEKRSGFEKLSIDTLTNAEFFFQDYLDNYFAYFFRRLLVYDL